MSHILGQTPDGVLTYRTSLVVDRVTQLMGKPNILVDGCDWTAGGSVLWILTDREDDSRCLVSTFSKKDPQEKYWSSDKFIPGASAGGLAATISRWLIKAEVDIGENLRLKILDSGIPYVQMGPYTYNRPCSIPVTMVNLAIGCLRGEIEPGVFLDAIKHDTNLLDSTDFRFHVGA